MKLRQRNNSSRKARAFMYLENLVASSILLLAIAGAFSLHIMGMKFYGVAETKLTASDEARKAVSYLVDEIREAKIVDIGTGALTSFQEIPIDTPQVGNAIQIYATTNKANFVRYYWDPSDRILKRTSDGQNAFTVIAHSISNNLVFSSEDFAGNILTNNHNNRVIGLTMEFHQSIDLTATGNGENGLYDYYRLRTKITRRALE